MCFCCSLISSVSLLTLINPIVSSHCAVHLFPLMLLVVKWTCTDLSHDRIKVEKSCSSAPADLRCAFSRGVHHPSFSCFIPELPLIPTPALLCSDGGMVQSQDDSIVGTKQCRHSVAIMPIPGNLSSSSPDLLQPATSVLDFSNPAGKKRIVPTVT